MARGLRDLLEAVAQRAVLDAHLAAVIASTPGPMAVLASDVRRIAGYLDAAVAVVALDGLHWHDQLVHLVVAMSLTQ